MLRSLAIRFEDPILVSVTSDGAEKTEREHFVYILNDPVSQMESVTKLLETAMGFDSFRARYTMQAVHWRGYAALGPFEVGAVDGILQSVELAARNLGMGKLTFAREAPNTAGWKETDKGLLPPG
jgi:ATP-dependent Clp protease adapter protein ClpS